MANDAPVIVDDGLIGKLTTTSNTPNTSFINTLGGFSSVDKANPAALKFYSDLVTKHPEIVTDKDSLFKVLNAYADEVYPNLDTYAETVNPFGGTSRTALQNDKTALIAKLNNGIQSFKTNILDKNAYIPESIAYQIAPTNTAQTPENIYFPPPSTTTTTTAPVSSTTTTTPPVSSTTTTTPIAATDSAAQQQAASGDARKKEGSAGASVSNPAQAGKECGDADKNAEGVCIVTPVVGGGESVAEGLEVQIAGGRERLKTSSTSDEPSLLNTINSWVISWEPTQKIGIVKVPLSKLISALGSSASTEKIADNVNSLQYYNDALLFDVPDLIDFKSVNRRIFLPLASNRMVIIKEFSIARKNIQQIELTHGSKYFQVFTETFPEFTLSIEAVKFADIAKKVKLFFDNVMKRISEPSKYSGSLYIYDILAEEIPSFNLSELTERLDTGQLIRYRLLPRSVKMSTSSEDPNMLKITLDGIIVEWEQQKARFKIPKIPDPKPDPGTGSQGGTVTPNAPNAPKQLIGPNEKYANNFNNITFSSSEQRNPKTPISDIVSRSGNNLWLQPEAANFYANQDSLWFLDLYVRTTDEQLYTITKYEESFTRNALNEIFRDTLGLYQEITSYLLEKEVAFKTPKEKANFYNSAIGKVMNDLKITNKPNQNLRQRFVQGYERYIRSLYPTKSAEFRAKFNVLLGGAPAANTPSTNAAPTQQSSKASRDVVASATAIKKHITDNKTQGSAAAFQRIFNASNEYSGPATGDLELKAKQATFKNSVIAYIINSSSACSSISACPSEDFVKALNYLALVVGMDAGTKTEFVKSYKDTYNK